MKMKPLETERLNLRPITFDDAEFALALIRDPDYIEFINERQADTIEDGKAYVSELQNLHYKKTGYGLLLVERKEDGAAIGLCGLIKRDELEDVDVGFAFLPDYRSQGYAYEAAVACMDFGKNELGLPRIVAITKKGNKRSAALLKKLGLDKKKIIEYRGDGGNTWYFYP